MANRNRNQNTRTKKSAPVKETSTAENQPTFSKIRCLQWFQKYTTPDDPETLGPEGMEQLCKDIGVAPEDIVMLVLAYKMRACQMGYFSKEEWLKGLSEMNCDSIEKLHSALDHLRSLLAAEDTFRAIYRYAYDFARENKNQRYIDMETAKAMLQLLLGKWPLSSQFSRFLDQSSQKVMNKDEWYNILEFATTISKDLSNYDASASWPLMLDEFVEWSKAAGSVELMIE